MRVSNLLIAAAVASSLVAAPAMANPAASLSVAKASGVKASSKGKKSNDLAGAGLAVVAVLGVGAAVAGVVAATNDGNSDSN